jgi:hypothetical protein
MISKFFMRQDSLKAMDKVRIADITFARTNGAIIKLLKKRGKAIVKHDFEKAHQIED